MILESEFQWKYWETISVSYWNNIFLYLADF